MKSSVDKFKTRIHELDFFRGVLICLVILDHLLGLINLYIFHNDQAFLNWYLTSQFRNVMRQIVLFSFMFVCGISCYLSRNNLKRGLLLLLLSIGITLITHLLQLMPLFNGRILAIDINIIGVIAISILLYVIFENRSNKDLLIVIAILVLFYFFILITLRNINGGEYNPFLSVLYYKGNPIKEKFVGDYLPLFPYVIFLFFGVLFARMFLKNKQSYFKRRNFERPICFLGRHTLIFYIAHEVVLTLIFMGIGALL